ncbi:cache domain-containing protein [Enterovibrio coralii]|uniref:cache domain-containing protein n=1 Tax=Enterovibrio coralii TaxID=294935 RepID=UPI001E3FBFA6|nr:cache domain-containing protein [Enterovibrio coralii]
MSFKALWILGLMLAVVVITIAYVMETTGDSMVRDSANQRVEAQVENVARTLGQLSNNVSTVALSLADTLELSDSPEEIEHKLAVMLSNENIRSVVASGGFWPEPNIYSPGDAKASVFIAFNEDGSYHRIDDYNSDTARPYHVEEWYAPTRFVRGAAYWSRAYVDPYTNEPMVTCSVPIIKNDEFRGVVTIDVRLAELRVFLSRSGQKLGGYLAMLDRGGRLMSYPDSVKPVASGTHQLPSVLEIAYRDSRFNELALAISSALQGERLALQSNANVQDLAEQIVMATPDIDLGYALSIAAELDPDQSVFRGTEKLFIHQLDVDPVLDEPTLVLARVLPGTNWMLIGALPERLLKVEATTLKNDLFFAMAFVGLLLVVVTYLAIHFHIVRPMARVRHALETQAQTGHFHRLTTKRKMNSACWCRSSTN